MPKRRFIKAIRRVNPKTRGGNFIHKSQIATRYVVPYKGYCCYGGNLCRLYSSRGKFLRNNFTRCVLLPGGTLVRGISGSVPTVRTTLYRPLSYSTCTIGRAKVKVRSAIIVSKLKTVNVKVLRFTLLQGPGEMVKVSAGSTLYRVTGGLKTTRILGPVGRSIAGEVVRLASKINYSVCVRTAKGPTSIRAKVGYLEGRKVLFVCDIFGGGTRVSLGRVDRFGRLHMVKKRLDPKTFPCAVSYLRGNGVGTGIVMASVFTLGRVSRTVSTGGPSEISVGAILIPWRKMIAVGV